MYTLRELTEKFKTDSKFNGDVLENEKMSLHTTMHVGGTAPLFLVPKDEKSFLYALSICRLSGFKDNSKKIPLFILGGGSNIIVSDKGFDGVVITTKEMNKIRAIVSLRKKKTLRLHCEAGADWAQIVLFCTQHIITGFEKFNGLPGTVGGALYMNARCFGENVSDRLLTVRYLENETLHTYHYNRDDWGYKKSPFQKNSCVIISADFSLKCEKRRYLFYSKKIPLNFSNQSAAQYALFLNERNLKGHFKAPSAGSVFKNNHNFGAPCGKIIDECGLRGYKIGGAQVAPWHGNFIINTGTATASDIKALVDFCIEQVRIKKGFVLEPEIIFCGK